MVTRTVLTIMTFQNSAVVAIEASLINTSRGDGKIKGNPTKAEHSHHPPIQNRTIRIILRVRFINVSGDVIEILCRKSITN